MDLDALEAHARQILDPATYDYFAGGADDEVTLSSNRDAWDDLRLMPHVLRDVAHIDTSTTVLGAPVSMPVLVAPMAYQRLAHPDGETATAHAAGEASTVMVVSTMATTSLEDVASEVPGAPRWFQLYVQRDRGITAELVQRAAASGYSALVLTVDLAVLGNRRRDDRNRFTLPPGMPIANVGRTFPATDEGSGLMADANHHMDPSMSFADLEWLRSLSDLPIVIKGVVRGDDASDIVAHGASGIVVSNHGGRQLDGTLATAEAVVDVVDSVGGRVDVFVDGGVRRGTDVVRALALGARAVLVGRPVLWGLAVGGAGGVLQVLEGFRDELERAMALCGVRTVDEITRDLVSHRRSVR